MDPTFIKPYTNAVRHIARHGAPGMSCAALAESSDVEIASGIFGVAQSDVASDILAFRAGEDLGDAIEFAA